MRPDFLRFLRCNKAKVNVEKKMRIAISELEPRFEHIIKYIYETIKLILTY